MTKQRAFLSAASVLMVSGSCASEPVMPPDPPPLFDSTPPRNLDEALDLLSRGLPVRDRKEISAMTERQFVTLSNLSSAADSNGLDLGTRIRHRWGLYSASPLREFFQSRGLIHPEDMSAVVLTSFWRHLHGQEIRFEDQLDCCRRWWDEYERIKNHALADGLPFPIPVATCPLGDCEVGTTIGSPRETPRTDLGGPG